MSCNWVYTEILTWTRLALFIPRFCVVGMFNVVTGVPLAEFEELRMCPTRWAPTSYKWSCDLYKWPYKWITGVTTPISGVITLVGAHFAGIQASY